MVSSRYEILESLGQGGMGMVFKARDRVLDEVVALKVLRTDVATTPEMAERFRAEIKLARRVTHKNVCRIHEYGEDADLRYISMAFVDGVDLKQVLRQRGGLPRDEGFDVAIQVADGLEAIHEEGIIHRDLKSSNIMRDARGVVRLMDFGIAKQSQGDTLQGLTATGMIVGTPEYMSPEQARGQRLDVRSDVYSMGVVMYELFTGRVPFRGDTPIATIIKHLQEPPPLDLPEAAAIPRPLVGVLRQALAKDPSARHASAGAVAEALRRARPLAQDTTVTLTSTPQPAPTLVATRRAHPDAATVPAQRRRIRRSALVGLALGLGLLAAAPFVWRWASPPAESPAEVPSITLAPEPAATLAAAAGLPTPVPSPSAAAVAQGSASPAPIVARPAVANVPRPSEPVRPTSDATASRVLPEGGPALPTGPRPAVRVVSVNPPRVARGAEAGLVIEYSVEGVTAGADVEVLERRELKSAERSLQVMEERVRRANGAHTSLKAIRPPPETPPGVYTFEARVSIGGAESRGSAVFEVR